MIIWSEFRMGQYTDDDHLLYAEFRPNDHWKEAPHFIRPGKYQIDDTRFAVLRVSTFYIGSTYAFRHLVNF